MRADDAGTGLDGVAERVGRWAAARSTRRGFLGRAGRLAVLVAGGTTIVGLLTEEPAEARVCGQSGVAPKCPTYDCDATWGWCWYANGCCAHGYLKKICDCCAPNTANPVGYCPSGTRVLCIVESCGADPRLMTVGIERITNIAADRASVAVSRARFADGGAPVAVLGDAGSPHVAALGTSAGRVVGGPVLLTGRAGLDTAVSDEIARLGVRYVTIIGPQLDRRIDATLEGRGVEVERVGTATELSALSVEVAGWSRRLTGARTALVVHPSAPAEAIAPASALAHARRLPMLFGNPDQVRAGLEDPRPIRHTIVVASDPGRAGDYPGGTAVTADSPAGYATALAELGVGLGASRAMTSLAPLGDLRWATGAATVPGPLLLHEPGSLRGARAWLLERRRGISTAFVSGDASTFPDTARYELQSTLNEFEAHLLVGEPGQGLPVITQPWDERPIGLARDTRPGAGG